MTTDLLAAAAIFGTVLGLVMALGSLGTRRSLRVMSRLQRHSLSVQVEQPERTARINVLGRRPAGGAASLIGDTAFIQAVRRDLLFANVQIGVPRYFALRGALAAAAAAGAFIFAGGPLAPVVAACVGFMLPRFVIKKKGSRRAAALEKQLAETLDLLVGSMRAGLGLIQAIESASQEQTGVMGAELRLLVDQINLGVSISDAMEALVSRFKSQDLDLLAAAISINRQSGGSLSEVLDNLSRTVRQRRDIREEAKSLTAAPRATSYILAILPVAIAAYSTAASPIYREQLLFTPLGRLLLVAACAWSLIGFFISQKLAKIEY